MNFLQEGYTWGMLGQTERLKRYIQFLQLEAELQKEIDSEEDGDGAGMISKKVEYMKIAAALCDFHIGEKELDLLVGVYELERDIFERSSKLPCSD